MREERESEGGSVCNKLIAIDIVFLALSLFSSIHFRFQLLIVLLIQQ